MGRYEQKVIDGQIIKERVYTITGSGVRAGRNTGTSPSLTAASGIKELDLMNEERDQRADWERMSILKGASFSVPRAAREASARYSHSIGYSNSQFFNPS